MNDPLSDGIENTIDIFLLSESESDAPLITEHLEQKGYRVTPFSDVNYLFETLRFGKPNLLICDSLSLGDTAFGICRQIKADGDLWMVPVLIMTRASSLSDLLFVLDCNADNFIAYPYDPPYLQSLVEGMLVTPVERQTLEQIKTQFKIQHDDHMFVVTADRRKLLEFLLSSFEIAVNKSGELNRAESEIAQLRQAAFKAGEVAAEQGRVIAALNDNLKQREAAISALNNELRDKALQVADLSREKEFLVQEREANKNLIGETEDRVRVLTSEKEDADRRHIAEAGELGRQIALLNEELSRVQAELTATLESLDRKTAKKTELETTLAELVPAKEQLEKTCRALTLECEQVKTACSSEKNRAQAVEQENKSLILAKAQSEQDLTRIIDELKGTARQQASEIVAFRDELSRDKERISTLEKELADLTSAKEQAENNLKKAADDLKQELESARAAGETAAAALDGKSQRIDELERACATERSSIEQAREKITTLEGELGQLRSEIEEKNRQASELDSAFAAEKTAAVQAREKISSLEGELGQLRSEIEEKNRHAAELDSAFTAEKTAAVQARDKVQSLEKDLLSLREKLGEKGQNVSELEQICSELKDAGAQTMARIRALESETGDLRAALELERKQHEDTRKSLQGAVRERDEALSSLKGTQEVVKSDLTSHRDNLARVQQELAAATIERTALDGRLAETLSQVRSLEEKLTVASGEQADADRQVRALSDELGRVKADLEAERRQRRSGEDEARSALQVSEKVNAAVQQAATERDRLQKLLDAEREERRAAEERVRSLEDAGESQIRNLSQELADAKDRIAVLAEQVQTFREENERANARVTELEDEIEQARTALADEWENHVTDNERFAAAVLSPQPGSAGTPAGDDPAGESSPLRVTSVEDLFEDEPEEDTDEEELPAVSIIREAVPVAVPGIMAGDEILPGEDEEPAFGGEPDDEDLPGDEEESVPAGGDEGADDDSEVLSTSGPSFVPMPMGAGVSLNRSQWFDLLKWAHHSGALSQDQRLQIVKMGRLIQKGRRLTRHQETQVHEMISLARSLGYRPS